MAGKIDIRNTVHRNVENIFVELVETFKLQNGDITPLEANQLDIAKKSIEEVAVGYVLGNGGKIEGEWVQRKCIKDRKWP